MVAASPDGILVADKNRCEQIKPYVDALNNRLMYEERRWGTYKIISSFTFQMSRQFLVKYICICAGKSVSYQKHSHRDEEGTEKVSLRL